MELMLCSYYLERGITPDYVLSLSFREKLFLLASIKWHNERLNGKYDS